MAELKTKTELAFEHIAGLRGGVEQDLAELERWWPEARRGTRAGRAFQSLIERIESAIATAEENIGA